MNPDQSCQRDLSKPGRGGPGQAQGESASEPLATFHPFPVPRTPAWGRGPALALTLSGPHPAFPALFQGLCILVSFA